MTANAVFWGAMCCLGGSCICLFVMWWYIFMTNSETVTKELSKDAEKIYQLAIRKLKEGKRCGE